MSRVCVWLAVHTGIAPSVWAEEGEQAIVTAVDLLTDSGGGGRHDQQGRQMSG
jgi:hypothetical protein